MRVLAGMVCLLAPALAGALSLNHSGFLLGPTDEPVSGPATMTFRLFDAAENGAAAWASGACEVQVSAGYYAVALGDTCGGAISAAQLPAGGTRWLEVQVDSTVLVPRTAVVPAASALDAVALGGLNRAGFWEETEDLAGAKVGASTLATLLGGLVAKAGGNTIAGANAFTGATSFGSAGTTVIDAAGNVGIGVASPGVALDVSGTARATTFSGSGAALTNLAGAQYDATKTVQQAIEAKTIAAGTGLTLTDGTLSLTQAAGSLAIVSGTTMTASGGKIGIGTASPNAKLEVRGDYPQLRLDNAAAGSGSLIEFADAGALRQRVGHLTSTGYLQFATGGTDAAGTGLGVRMTIDQTGRVGIGTTAPGALLDVNGAVKIGGSETGTAASDLKAYIQKVACENRRGVWIDGTGCQEYAFYTSGACTYSSCTCPAGTHKCSFVDLFSGGFQSLRRPGYGLPSGAGYAWVAGSYTSEQDTFFYPWSHGGSTLRCNAGAHYMIDLRRDAAGNNAWGCYQDSYTQAAGICCRDNQ